MNLKKLRQPSANGRQAATEFDIMPHEEDKSIRFLTEFYGILDVPQDKIVELDLGCGAGSYTIAMAKRFPERHVYAADVMLGRLRKVVKRSARAEASNIEVLRVEARYLLGRLLPDRSLDRIHLLCPDPWPKGRHKGHRLLASDFTTQIHRVLKDDGIFHFSSDDEYYRDAVGRVLTDSGLFAPCNEAIADLQGIASDFELRWLEEGKTVPHRAWKKLPRPPPGAGH